MFMHLLHSYVQKNIKHPLRKAVFSAAAADKTYCLDFRIQRDLSRRTSGHCFLWA